MRTPIPELKFVSAQTAALSGYVAITEPIHPSREPQIFENIQRQLQGTDSVWIEALGGKFMAGRRERELLAVEALCDEDERRPRKGGRQSKSIETAALIEVKKGESSHE
jgi:hypothetical protein